MTKRPLLLVSAIWLASMLATVLLLSQAPAASETDIADRIANARTRADHEAIAKYYDEQAEEARGLAKKHEKMAEAYRRAGGPMVKAQMPEHCDGLAVYYSGLAKQNDAMAASHRRMAAEAK
jgi:hypothetical protein